MPVEGGGDSRGRGMCGPHPHAIGDTAEVQCIECDGLSQGEEQPDDLREVGEHEIQVSEPGVLVPRVLCGHGREEHREDKGIYNEPAEGGRAEWAVEHRRCDRPVYGEQVGSSQLADRLWAL